MKKYVIAYGLILGMLNTNAEVVHTTDNGFTVKNELAVSQTQAKAYQAMITEIHLWWASSHTFFGSSKNLSIDPRVGGCFCEIANESQQALHLNVVNVNTGKSIRMLGGLGPLQGMPVNGVMDWVVTQQNQKTIITFTYSVSGNTQGGLASIASPVDQVLKQQLQSLKKHLESQ